MPVRLAPIIDARPIVVNAQFPRVATAPVPLDPLTDRVMLRLKRPTVLVGRDWNLASTMRVRLVITCDTVVHECVGLVTGGIRPDPRSGGDADEYRLIWTPTWGHFGAQAGLPKRLGETSLSTFTVHAILEHVRGVIVTDMVLETTSQAAPAIPYHASIAFDAATSAVEDNGDNVMSLTHTSTGANRAVFAASITDTSRTATSITYGGTSMTEQWDLGATRSCAGYTLAGQATGAQTVTATISSATNGKFLGVISMTGVDQTTPVGTAASSEGNGNTQSDTVTSVGSTDFLVDALATSWASAATVGANQTSRLSVQDDGGNGVWCNMSTQSGADGGVMSWTTTNGNPWAHGAIAFKAAAATAVGHGAHFSFQRNRHVVPLGGLSS